MAQIEGLTVQGNPLTLQGNPPVVGSIAPDFQVHADLMKRVRFSENAAGKVIVLTTAPSVDTAVCAIQLRSFNQKVADLGDQVEIWYVTRDLAPALGRFCGAEGIDQVKTYSDAIDRSFGEAWGLVLNELGLLARSVFVINREGVVSYREIVDELTHEPDYDAALLAAKAAL